jgi:hypothetical protein
MNKNSTALIVFYKFPPSNIISVKQNSIKIRTIVNPRHLVDAINDMRDSHERTLLDSWQELDDEFLVLLTWKRV